jgi:hypothetical protein
MGEVHRKSKDDLGRLDVTVSAASASGSRLSADQALQNVCVGWRQQLADLKGELQCGLSILSRQFDQFDGDRIPIAILKTLGQLCCALCGIHRTMRLSIWGGSFLEREPQRVVKVGVVGV